MRDAPFKRKNKNKQKKNKNKKYQDKAQEVSWARVEETQKQSHFIATFNLHVQLLLWTYN